MRAISSNFRLERVRMSRELLFELVNHMKGGAPGYTCKLLCCILVFTDFQICYVDNVEDAQADKKFVGKSLKEISSSFVSTNPKNIIKTLAARLYIDIFLLVPILLPPPPYFLLE